jgi:putative endonuclease
LQAGHAAESAAVQFLQTQHLNILARNYRCRTGEIDIVGQTTDGVIVIAEVRLRASRNYGGGAASVDWRKQRKIQRAARHLLATHPALGRCAVRFDVLDIRPGVNGFEINWIRHAFDSSER